ncbi:MAG: elongation factor P [Chloroflexi bacterium]|nr:elongation factor P [Chloroflexota bacterium]
MIETGQIKKGSTLEIDGTLYQVLEIEHIKIGRGSAQVRMKLRDVRGGHIIDKSAQAGTRYQKARIERQEAQFLYPEGDFYNFMNTETFDQFPVPKDRIEEALPFLIENATCNLLMYNDEAVGIELPTAVALKVVETDPGIKGDTAQGATKSAKLETGHTVTVPLFINTGDVLKVDTRSGEYLERAK